MPSSTELGAERRAFARRRLETVAAEALAQEALLAAEPLVPPADPRERRAWEQRLASHHAAIRAGASYIADLLMVEHFSAAGDAGEATDDATA